MAWHCSTYGGYTMGTSEAEDNAKMIANVLVSLCGWTMHATCGLLGNYQYESGLNPWRWQDDNVQSTTSYLTATSVGYGLGQFTPSSKYIDKAQSYAGYGPNFSDQAGKITDGMAQLLFVNAEGDYITTSSYPLTYAEFKASTLDPSYLAAAWLYNYERSGDPQSSISDRQNAASFWWGVLGDGGYTPITPAGDFRYGGIRDVIRRLILHA